MDWYSLIPAAITGGLFGTLATLFVPWVNYGVEKRRLLREARVQLIGKIRGMMIDDQLSRVAFRESSEFHSIKPLLSEKTVLAICAPQNHIAVVFGEPNVVPYKRALLEDLARIERCFKLI
jgi:hypothetical protein